MNSKTLSSIAESNEITPIDNNGLQFFSKIMSDKSRIHPLSVLDPKTINYIGLVGRGSNRLLEVKGQWSPGDGHPWWGPTGSPNEKLNGMNKWCAVIIVTSFDGSDSFPFQYPGHPVNIPGADQFGVHIYVVMNDEAGKYDDNRNHPTDPMRV